MPRGGSKPGERRGGREKGTPNKRTVALHAAAAAVAAKVPAVDPSQIIPRKKAREVLHKFMVTLEGMAGFYQVAPPGSRENPNADHDRFVDCATLAIRCATELQQYEEPKLRALLVAQGDGMGSGKQIEGSVVKMPVGDPVRAARVYRMLLEGGPAPAKKTG